MEVQKFWMYEKHKKYLYFVLAVVITYISVQREITVAEKRRGGTGCYIGPKIMLPIWYQQPSLSVNGISLLFEEAAAADKPNRIRAYSTYKMHFYATWVAENQIILYDFISCTPSPPPRWWFALVVVLGPHRLTFYVTAQESIVHKDVSQRGNTQLNQQQHCCVSILLQ